MTARTTRHHTTQAINKPSDQTAQARMITASSVVTNSVVRAPGLVPTRLDLVHVGTTEQQLGLTLGSVLVDRLSFDTSIALRERGVDLCCCGGASTRQGGRVDG